MYRYDCRFDTIIPQASCVPIAGVLKGKFIETMATNP
jgi:hypothetical protein